MVSAWITPVRDLVSETQALLYLIHALIKNTKAYVPFYCKDNLQTVNQSLGL